MNSEKNKKYFYQSLLIRRTEEVIEKLFLEGKLFGTTHGCIGQEIIAVSVLDKIDIKKDSVTGNHRSHGHYLALFDDPESLIGELMGKSNGVIKGKGGSQHLYRDNFYTNGITGGMIPVGTGIALSEKLNKTSNIVVSFLGDGAMNEGYVSEAFNFASKHELPILFVLENNHYAMSTPVKAATAGSFIERLKALEVETFKPDEYELDKIEDEALKAVNYVRNNRKPAFLQIDTYRFCGHSKSDRCEYRTKEEEKLWLKKDVLKQLQDTLDEETVLEINTDIENKIKIAVEKCENAKWPDPSEIYNLH